MNQNERHIIESLEKRKTEMPSGDYFSSLKASVLEQIAAEAKIIPLYKRWWFVSAAAASVVMIIGVSIFMKQETSSNTTPDWNSVSKEEMYAYVEQNIQDFETDDVADQLDDIPQWNSTVSFTGNASASKNAKTEDLFKELDKEEILEYLQEEVVDIDDELITGN